MSELKKKDIYKKDTQNLTERYDQYLAQLKKTNQLSPQLLKKSFDDYMEEVAKFYSLSVDLRSDYLLQYEGDEGAE